MGQKTSVSYSAALTVLECDSSVQSNTVINSSTAGRARSGSYFTDVLNGVVIRKDAEILAPKVASKALRGPDNTASFRAERSPWVSESRVARLIYEMDITEPFCCPCSRSAPKLSM